jgi:hypothetical protein
LEVSQNSPTSRGRRGRDRMVVGFTNTCAISAYHYLKKFVSDLRQVGGFLRGFPVSSTNKTDRHDITEMLLKVALNTINQPIPLHLNFHFEKKE